MTRIVLYSLFFLLTTSLLSAQPLKKNLPFRNDQEMAAPQKIDSLTMDFFRYRTQRLWDSPSTFNLFHAMQTKPGFALLGSAAIPGLGQAANKKWVRAAAYFVADAILLGVHLKSQQRGRELQREYEQFADNNWSVVTYAKWLMQYHDYNNISNPYIDELRQQVQGETAAYDPEIDWETIDLKTLRKVEKNTPFVFPDGSKGNTFSHEMPDYGSQQYYELISKYFQYGVGWNDFGVDRQEQMLDNMYQLSWDGRDMPPHFFMGADMAERFNDKYRTAGNMLAFMLLNHVVSAFDAFLTVKLKNNRLEAESNLMGTRQFTLKYHF